MKIPAKMKKTIEKKLHSMVSTFFRNIKYSFRLLDVRALKNSIRYVNDRKAALFQHMSVLRN